MSGQNDDVRAKVALVLGGMDFAARLAWERALLGVGRDIMIAEPQLISLEEMARPIPTLTRCKAYQGIEEGTNRKARRMAKARARK